MSLKEALVGPWARPAGMLGRLAGWEMAHGKREIDAQIAEALANIENLKLLEIGCGPGATLALLAERLPRAHLTGTDPSEVMLAQARRRNAAAIESGRVRILRAPAEALPFDDASFDRAIAINTVGHWDDRLAGLREARRVLRRNGRLVIASRHDALRPPPRELVSALLAAGFALPEEVPVPADPMRGSALLAALAR